MFRRKEGDSGSRGLEIEEVRLISDLRVMHTKVDELYQVVRSMKDHHDEFSIVEYADSSALGSDIQKVDEIYMWFVRLKEEVDTQTRRKP